ncbi:Maf-like protein, putative [Plasmodium gallinaceum]|uniref:Maf-like protein, putative n=1 Tax=Plasmodium gallinaceum TaxID=5849 RepID=A0A1J1GZ82_PLAGA|nr:Maf-like protein, putative [Plasmodium gallinaceum]CRG96609.1 Maf-like protein, putative [Plasmodium gallinaceum]
MNEPNYKEYKTNNIYNKENELNNRNILKEEENIKNEDQLYNEFELEIDEEVISNLSFCVYNKNVNHKIIKVNNLIDSNLYNYIVNDKVYVEKEVNEISNNSLHFDNTKKNISVKNSSDELCNSVIEENQNTCICEEYDNLNKIEMMKCISEDINIYSNKKKNDVLFLCYDEKNDECDLCDRYRKNYMSNMQTLNSSNIKNLNDLNDYFFILGSTSNSRKYILKKNNLNFLSIHIKIDEKKIGCRKRHDPFTLTSNISIAKGLKLLSMIKNNIELKKKILELSKNKKLLLLVGDEVIYCNNKIYEKPKDKNEAYNFLKSYNNNKCFSYSSITLIDFITERIVTGIDESVIKICDMNDNIINKILDDLTIYFCAGALKIENTFMHKHIKEIKGNIDSIFGLSVNLLFHLVNFL